MKTKKTGIIKVVNKVKLFFTGPYFLRFLRVIVPQLVVLIASLTNLIPEKYYVFWVVLGAAITALDKYLRDEQVYSKVVGKFRK